MSPPRVPTLSDRTSGVLLHPTSLPGADLGSSAHEMVDFLAAAGQSWWQTLPIGPPGQGNSPYSAQSAFAGSPAADQRRTPGRRRPAGRSPSRPAARGPAAGRLSGFCRKRPGLRAVHAGGDRLARGLCPLPGPQARPRGRSLDRLASPSCASATRARSPAPAASWPPSSPSNGSCSGGSSATGARCATTRTASAASRSSATCPSSWPTTAPTSGSTASCSTWTAAERRRWSRACRRTTSARPASAGETRSTAGTGCARPATPGGSTGFRMALAVFDAVRLDHFIGFTRYWEIPASAPTAVTGQWRKGPGAPLFQAAQAALGPLPLMAEDLGAVTPEVEGAARRFGFPGHEGAAVRLRDRPAGADVLAPQLPAPRRRLHRHARQRHDGRLVPRPWQRQPQRRTDGEGTPQRPALPGRPSGETDGRSIG